MKVWHQSVQAIQCHLKRMIHQSTVILSGDKDEFLQVMLYPFLDSQVVLYLYTKCKPYNLYCEFDNRQAHASLPTFSILHPLPAVESSTGRRQIGDQGSLENIWVIGCH